MSTSVTPPIPRQPIGRTFVVSVILLGLFGCVQLLAVARHYLPLLRSQILEARERTPEVQPEEPQKSQPLAMQPAQDPAQIAQAAQFVAEADRNFRVGDFEASLRLLQKAAAILPTDAAIQFRFGQVYEALDDKAQAFTAFERSVAVPGLPPEIRRQAEQKMALLMQALGGIPDAGTTAPPPEAANPAPGQPPLRDVIGLQPGSVLGIVDARIQDSQPGGKTLRIAIKSRPGTKIDPLQMRMHVFFYEQDETGEVVSTEAKSSTQWISPPVDWNDGEPELLDVEYPLPDGGLPGNSAEFGALGRKYYGYVVGVYYNKELQDSRADPGRLDSLYPLPLALESSSSSQ